jgi:Fe-S-cluster containining protein
MDLSMHIPAPIMIELEQLLARMDQAYRQTAGAAGFECRGCLQNCCRTLFFHHTLTELLYLKAGLAGLSAEVHNRIRERAAGAVDRMRGTEQAQQPSAGTMCPLNEQDRCMLYAHRPMICRLHGLPHRLQRPDGKVLSGPGCDDFYRQCGSASSVALDRTPHYTAMAGLEKALRQKWDFGARIKMTVARMVVVELGGYRGVKEL